jgi:formylglycine-generating enzyme required for sulfatase activity
MDMDEDWSQTPEGVSDFYRDLLPRNYEYRYRITLPGDEAWPHALSGNSWFGQLQLLMLCVLYKVSRHRRLIRKQFDLPSVLTALSLPYAVRSKRFASRTFNRLPRLSTSRVAISASSAKPRVKSGADALASAWSPVGDILRKLLAAVKIAVPQTKIIVVATGQAFDSLVYKQPDPKRGIWDDPESEFKLIKAGSLKEFLTLLFHIHRWRRRLMILALPITTCLCTVGLLLYLSPGPLDVQMARLITAIQNEESLDGHRPGRDSIARGFEKWRSISGLSSKTALKRVHVFLATGSAEPTKRMRALFLADKLRMLNSSFPQPTNALVINDKSVGIMLLRLEPGGFLMGASESELDPKDKRDELMAATEVTLTRPFWIGKYEVTQTEFEAVTTRNPSFFNGKKERTNEWDTFDYGDGSLRPVETVTWNDAMAFCDLLSKWNREKIDEVAGSNYVIRLPTEAEWEYACRAGTTNAFGFDDACKTSSVVDEHAWISKDRAMAVGLKLPNPWGLYDMQGNVNEFCFDSFQWVQDFRPSTNDPVSVFPSDRRAVRGGAYSDGSATRRFKCAYRFGLEATDPGKTFGFRIVLGPKIELLNQRKEISR